MFQAAVIPSILFLSLIQWALLLGWMALAGRRRARHGGAHTALMVLAPACLAGACLALALVPTEHLASWRLALLVPILPALLAWGRLMLLPSPSPLEISKRRLAVDRLWGGLAAVLWLLVLAGCCAWLAAWFVERNDGRPHPLPSPIAILAASLVLHRLVGVVLLGVFLKGALDALANGLALSAYQRQRRVQTLGQLGMTLAGWRLVALGLSLGTGMLAHPGGGRHFLELVALNGGMLLLVRTLLGTILPAIHAWFGVQLANEGNVDLAIQQFVPGCIMVAFGEVLGAGLSFGLLGLGF